MSRRHAYRITTPVLQVQKGLRVSRQTSPKSYEEKHEKLLTLNS